MADGVTPAVLRAEAERALAPMGRRRKRIVRELEDLDEKLRPIVLAALAVEVPYRRIHEITGLSTTTVAKWRRRYEAEQATGRHSR